MKRTTTFLLLALAAPLTSAAPIGPIAEMINTPASTFDAFLYRLHDQAKCSQNWFGNSEASKTPLCIAVLKYSLENNLVEMNFVIDQNHPKLGNFTRLDERGKEAALLKALDYVAQAVGVTSLSMSMDVVGGGKEEVSIGPLGMIQMTTIRYGWATADFDEDALKDEVAKRTVINLRTVSGDSLYTATRNQHGKVAFTREAKDF